MSEDKFSAENHKRCESAYFEDLAVGEEFYIPSRTVTESHFAGEDARPWQRATAALIRISLHQTSNLMPCAKGSSSE